MAKIPGVPTIDPVDKPMESPAEAGKVGAAIAGLGEATQDVVQTGFQVELFLKKAQQNVDETTFQNNAHALMLQYQDALAKTTNSRDVAAVTKEYQDNLQANVKRWEKSPALIQIQQQADGLTPQLTHLGTVKTADLQVKESAVQSEIQKQTLLPQLVNAVRNGDKATEDFINGAMDHQYAEREKAGLISHAQVELEKNADQIRFRTQLNESYIESNDPKERLSAIAQLKSGGSGPLNLEGLAAGDIAALRVQAESKNRELDNLAEAGNLNKALNVTQAAFSAPEYKNNYEARVNSLQDGDWLTKHGIVAPDGSPDRVMAEKLIAETNRQRGEWEKERADRDEKAINKIEPLIIGNSLSRGQLVQISQQEQLSPRAYAAVLAKWDENQRYNHQVATEGRILANQERQQRSQDVAAGFNLLIAQGGVPSVHDILTTPGMTKADQSTVIERAKRAREDKPYQEGLSIISNAYPVNTKKMTPEQQNQQNEMYLRTAQAYDQEINAHPDEDKSAIAGKLVMPSIVRTAIQKSVPSTVPVAPVAVKTEHHPLKAIGDFLFGGASKDLEKGYNAAENKLAQPLDKPTSKPPTNPAKGDKFNGFTWDGNGWTK